MRFADVDAVTVDAYGTLLVLDDPVGRLREALAAHGVNRNRADVERGFRAEVAYYAAHKQRAGDQTRLERLRERCAAVFLAEVAAELDPGAFVPAFVDSLVFELLPGAVAALDGLAARALALAVVANWDVSLREHLERHGLASCFAAVVLSPEAGAEKPHPRPFQIALGALGVQPERAVHVGDGDADELGAAAAGMRFVPAPLASAFTRWR